MDNPGWTYWGIVVLVMLASMWSVVRYIHDQRQESRKEVERAKREADEATRRERARAASDQITRDTYRIGDGAEQVHPDDLVKLATSEKVGPVLAREFMRANPDAVRTDEQGTTVNRSAFLRWLTAYRGTPDPYPPLVGPSSEGDRGEHQVKGPNPSEGLE